METKTKRTPGPWTVGRMGMIFEEKTGQEIGHVRSTAINPCDRSYTASNMEANARLIAAAPDLLDALRHTLARLDDIESRGSISFRSDVIGDIRAAIAKAEGV